MTKQQNRFLKIIGITPQQAYDEHNILPIEILSKKSCTNIVERFLKDETHPLTQAQKQSTTTKILHQKLPN